MTARLVDLDVASWQPEIPDLLMNLRGRPALPLPPGTGPRQVETAERAVLCLEIVRLARESDGGALSTSEIAQRREALARARPRGASRPRGRLLGPVAGRDYPAAVTERLGDKTPKTLLITLTGKDRPGVTSLVFDTLARFGVEVLDIEQIVLRGRLVLGLLVSSPRDWRALHTRLADVAAGLSA